MNEALKEIIDYCQYHPRRMVSIRVEEVGGRPTVRFAVIHEGGVKDRSVVCGPINADTLAPIAEGTHGEISKAIQEARRGKP